MEAGHHPTPDDLEYIAVTLFTSAVVITSVRLYLRASKRSWWWDDTFALLSMICVLAMGIFFLASPRLSVHDRVTAYYALLVGFYIPVWTTRLSILFTIIRIAPLSSQRRVLLFFSGSFVFQFILLTIESVWVCEISNPEWKRVPFGTCYLGQAVSVTQVLTTLLSDMVLVISPLVILRNVRVTPGIRFRLFSLFAVSIFTTISALIHAAFIIALPGVIEAVSAVVQVFIALVVCNVSVLVPALFRQFSDKEAFIDNKDFTTNTVAGSFLKHNPNSTSLSTLRVTDVNSTALCVHVNVIKEEIQNEDVAWDGKAGDVEYFNGTKHVCGYAS